MGTTISRRLVFVKMKRKPPPPKPKYSVRADNALVGGETPRSSSVFVARHAVAPAERRRIGWWAAGCWVGGLSLLVGIVALLVSLSDPPIDTGEQVQAARRGGDGLPGYARPSTGGYAGGSPNDANSRISPAQAFLNAPFSKRR